MWGYGYCVDFTATQIKKCIVEYYPVKHFQLTDH